MDPNFASITVHEEVVGLVEVVRLLDEHDKFLLCETRSFHSTFEYLFCRNRLGTRVFESLLDSQREPALCRSRRICSHSELWLGISRTIGTCDSNGFTTGLPVLS